MPWTFIYVICGWIFSLCLHEWAHAKVAYEGGDTSVEEKGYLSFNPLKYMDPLFSIILPLIFLIMGGLGLPGGAVYIDERRLKSPLWGTMVSLAGPAANLAVAVIIGLIFRFIPPPIDAGGPALAFIGMLQVMAVFFNLIPIPPLDGFGALRPHLDPQTRAFFDSFSMFGLLILFVLFNSVEAISRPFWTMIYLVCIALGIPVEWLEIGQDQFFFWR